MSHDTFSFDVAVVLGVAAVTSVLARLLRQPSVLGYLFAGLVVGPYVAIPIFVDAERVEAMAEFGVVLVMFAVGLEFRVKHLREVLPTSGLTALLQVGFLLWAGISLGQALGWSVVEASFLGTSISISSTMLVSKVFEERPVSPDVRSNVFGILVIQDIVAIVLIAAMTAVAAGGDLEPAALILTVLRLGGVLIAMLGVGMFLVPRALRAAARTKNAEMLAVIAVALCFGMAELAAGLGYSVALGAFLAGMLAAESGRAHDVGHLIAPLRDVFAAIFFVSIGMTVDPSVAWHSLPLALLVYAVVVVGQLGSVSVAGLLSGNGLRRSITAGLALGQIGEFAFILVGIGIAAKVVRQELRPILVTVAILSAFSTPLLLRLAPSIVDAVDRGMPRRLRRLLLLHEGWVARLRADPQGAPGMPRMSKAVRTIVADAVGCVLILSITARWSPMAGDWLALHVGISHRVARYAVLLVAFIGVVPLLYSAVKNALAFCRLLVDRVLPAGAGDPLGVRVSRQSLQVTLVLATALGIGVPTIATLRPVMGGLTGGLLLAALIVGIAVHLWRHANVLDHEFESGAEKLTALMARQAGPADAAELHDPSLLPGLDHAVAIRIDARAFAVSKTLRDVHLRALTGATVVAIRRDGAPASLATGDERLEPGDVLAVVGTDDAIHRARTLLDNGPEAMSADEAGVGPGARG